MTTERTIYDLSDRLSGGHGHLALHYSGDKWQAVAFVKPPRKKNRWVAGYGNSPEHAMSVLLGKMYREYT